MTTIDNLQRIRAKCARVLAANEKEPHTLLATHVAALRSTIAAIDAYILDESNSDSRNDLSAVADAIIAAWPEELL